MIAGEHNSEFPPRLQEAVVVLEHFATSAELSLDRIVAGRVLSEAERAIGGEDALAWSHRLVEVGESINLRVRALEGTLGDALLLVRQGIPVALCANAMDGDVRWTVLMEIKRRKIRVVNPSDGTESWVPRKRLLQVLGLDSPTSLGQWVFGRAASTCQVQARSPNDETRGEPPSPFSRLIGLSRPERRDIWVILVFSLVVGVLALATPIAVEALVNTVAFGRYLQPVVILAILLFTFLAFAAAMGGLMTFVVEVLQRRLFIRVVEDLAYRLPRARQEQFDHQHGPELVNRFFDVVTVQKAAAALLLDGISIVLQTVIGMAVLAFYHPFLLGFDVVLLILIAVTVFGLGHGAVKTAIKESKAKYAIASWLEELVRHPTAFKLHAGDRFAFERADQLTISWLERRRNHFAVVIRQILFALGIQAVAATALLGLGGWLVVTGELTLGQLVAAELIVAVIVGSFAKLGKHMESFYDLLASVNKLGVLFDLEIEDHDNLFHLSEGVPASVNVCHVSYHMNAKPVVMDVSFELSAGESVALTGPAGCGKSILVDLLCGMRAPTSGHIELDGIDLRELRPDSLRQNLALARSVEVFHGTINENVHLNRPNVSVSAVRDALEAVGLLDEILQLPEGLNTVLQTNGAPLSSSQAARLMVARAVCGRPRLLLIDGTLDGLSDELAAALLAKLTQDGTPWTLLLVTGRHMLRDECTRRVTLGDRSPGNGAASHSKLESDDFNFFDGTVHE